MLIDTRKSPYAQVYSLHHGDIKWSEGFWSERQRVCAEVTIPHVLSVFDDKESVFHQVENFRIAAGLSDGEFRGTPYGDGDFYKLMEGMVYAFAVSGDRAVDAKLDEYIELIGKAQQEDGYLSTKQIIGKKKGVQRHGNINDFEEYNFGHMFTSACVHYRVTGKDSFLNIAIRCAGYLEGMYAEILSGNKARTAVCPSHYMGLAELYRATGDKKYLRLASEAIAIRDMVENGTDDNQDRIPLREHRKIVGHAVRSTYLYAGVADLYLETGEAELLTVLQSCWDDLVTGKIYINGGCGALYTGTSPFSMFFQAQYVHQAFGYEYQLPNITAYNETCGTLGSIFWANRMFAIDPQAKYLDQIERSYYNLVMAAVSLDGNKYFYENMLRRTKELGYDVMWPLERKSVFKCFCCPTNLSRSVMQTTEYAYKLSKDAVWTGMYGASEAAIALENGAEFTLTQRTGYPFDGKIELEVNGLSPEAAFTLKLRVPAWAESGYVLYKGSKRVLTAKDANTFADVTVSGNEKVEVFFDMPARLTVSHAKVEENTNQVCVERGPLVYCVENPDTGLDTLDDLFLTSDAVFEEESIEIRGCRLTALNTTGAALIKREYDRDALYQPLRVGGVRELPVRLVPYFAWDNRGFGEMRVWIPILYKF